VILARGYVVWAAWPLVAALVVYPGVRRWASVCHTLGVLLLTTYAFWIASVAFFPMPIGGSPGLVDWLGLNLVPLRSLIDSFSHLEWRQIVRVHGGNVLLLVPFTLLGPVLWSRLRAWWKALAVGLGVSLGIELTQLGLSALAGGFYRSVDIDDIILNTAGALLGYGFYLLGRGLAHRVRHPRDS
jgi:glycopeptide antibiotics resistance protein